MKVAIDKNKIGIILVPRRSSRYPEVKLADFDYADDITLFEESNAEMANTTEAIRAIAGKLGLKMSYKKTAIMSIGQASGSNSIVPLGNKGLIKVVDCFKYLGAFCSADGTNVKELNGRIGKASAAFSELKKVWQDRNINLDTNIKFYNACTSGSQPMENEVTADQRLLDEQSSRKTSAKWTWVGL